MAEARSTRAFLPSWVRRRLHPPPSDDWTGQQPPGPFASLAPTLGELLKLCRAEASPVYLGTDRALCRCLGAFKLFVDPRDRGFAANLLLDGYWEPWATLFIAQTVRPGMTAIDVGANYGYYTLLLSWLVGESGRVVAIEPNPDAAESLRQSVGLNGRATHVTVINAAAGATNDGEALLFVPDGEPKNASIIPSAEAIGSAPGRLHAVPQLTLDRIAADLPRIDFIKIDAEGAEEAIVTGMGATLLRDKPRLMLEFNAGRGTDPGGLLDRLRAIYGGLRYIGIAGEPVATTREHLLTERHGLDWLLCLGPD